MSVEIGHEPERPWRDEMKKTLDSNLQEDLRDRADLSIDVDRSYLAYYLSVH
jgi:hypothetical protein